MSKGEFRAAVLFFALNLLTSPAWADGIGSGSCSIDAASSCSVPGTGAESGAHERASNAPSSKEAAAPSLPVTVPLDAPPVLIELFYAFDCPHCHEALAWLPELQKQFPNVKLESFEIKKNAENRKRFDERAKRANAKPSGVPTFFIGDKVFVGFYKDQTCNLLLDEVRRLTFRGKEAECASTEIKVPFLGTLKTSQISLLQFSIVIGLLDGLNPCAMWVLMFLLGLLVYSKSRKHVMLIGSIFVVASGLVYFSFMTAWLNLFLVIGYSRLITLALALVAILMGLVNLKELFFFKKGVSLMIPDSAKPKIAQKARNIIYERNLWFSISATVLLAVFVNFIELGCTIGLPAIFTKLLSDRNLAGSSRYGYMALYNIAYVIPLAIIVSAFGFTLGRFKMTEQHGKILKLVSGGLMLLLGLLMLIKPQLLIFT